MQINNLGYWVQRWVLLGLSLLLVAVALVPRAAFAQSLSTLLMPPVAMEEVEEKSDPQPDEVVEYSDNLYFWPASSNAGELTSTLNPYWRWHRLHHKNDNDLLKVQLHRPQPQQDLRLATFVDAQSDVLLMTYSKSPNIDFYLYCYPLASVNPNVVASAPDIVLPGQSNAQQLMADISRRERVQHSVSVSLPLSPQRLVLRFKHAGTDSLNESVTVHNLEVPAVLDADTDGLPDSFEHIIYGNLNLHSAQSAALADEDQDGLSDVDELMLGTHPVSADSDDDGIPDGWEQDHGLPILEANTWQDSDGDQVSDYEEWLQDSDPSMEDAPKSWLLTFDEHRSYGVYFWPAWNPRGDLWMKQARNYWQRMRNAQNQWVLRASSRFGEEVNIFTATFFKPLGRKARVTFSKSVGTRFFIYSQPTSSTHHYRVYQDLGDSRQRHSVTLTLPDGPQRLVLRMLRPNDGREHHIDLHSMLLPALADSDHNGVSDAFEHIYCYEAQCFSPLGLHVR